MIATSYVLHNGKVITLNERSEIASALLVVNESIVAVGDNKDVMAAAPPHAKHIDLAGRSVVPGFFDGHAHMDREGLKDCGGLSLAGLRSVSEVVAAVADAARQAAPGEWIVCMPLGDPPYGYFNDPHQLAESRFPTRHDLDAVAPDNPVYIRGVWGWWGTPPFPSIANSAALRMAGVTRDTPEPYNVTIEKDAHGEPTGVFLERNRAPILEYTLFSGLPRFTFADRLKAVSAGAAAYSALGTTSCYEGHGLTPMLQRAYNRAAREGALPVRVNAPLSIPSSAKPLAEIKHLLFHYAGLASGQGASAGHLTVDGITLDLGDPRVASVMAAQYPYEQWAGFFYGGLSDAEFVEIGTCAVELGMRLNVFLCDAPPIYSMERALSLIEEVDRRTPIAGLRCVGMHLGNATDSQLDRIKKLGLCVTMTIPFLHHHSAAFCLNGRGDEAMPVRRVLDAGIPVAFATDNVPPSMLFTLWESLARWDSTAGRTEGRSHLSREEALRIACQSGHYLTWSEKHRGVLAPGYQADIVVLGDDVLECELDRIPALDVVMTMTGGQIVHNTL